MDCRSVHMAFSLGQMGARCTNVLQYIVTKLFSYHDFFFFLHEINEMMSLIPQSTHQVVLYILLYCKKAL